MAHTLSLQPSLGVKLQRNLQQHWNTKLLMSSENPFPLAPVNFQEAELVTESNYLAQNAAFGEFCSSNMVRELETFSVAGCTDVPMIEIFGAGLARDLQWMKEASKKGFGMRVRDISFTAMSSLNYWFPRLLRDGLIRLVLGEIRKTLESEPIELNRTMAFYASQFFQVLPPRKMRCVLEQVGAALISAPPGIRPALYIVHPLPEDNAELSGWEGKWLPVVWGDTTMYSKKQLCFALERSAGVRKVTVEEMGKHRYYNQCYTMLKVWFPS